MKKNIWLFSAVLALTAATALAQDTAPAATSAAPSSETAKPKKPKANSIKKRVEMNPPASAVAKGKTINVRGKPSFNGEVLGHLENGASVTVLEQITLNHPPSGEPADWYKIAMPTNIPVWVDADFIDASTKAVKARRVNLRGGPGENYSVVGRLEKGAMISELREEKGWAAIQAPADAYAYVAAELLEIQATPAPVAVAPAPAPEVVNVPPPAAPVAAATTPVPAQPTAAAPVAPAPTAQSESEQELAALRQAVAPEPAPTAAALAPAPALNPAEPAVPRVVTREGFVHKSYNIQSPADYELHDIKNGELIEYLQAGAQVNFKIYVGTRVTVTGSEVIDQRWPRTPVLTVQSVDLMP